MGKGYLMEGGVGHRNSDSLDEMQQQKRLLDGCILLRRYTRKWPHPHAGVEMTSFPSRRDLLFRTPTRHPEATHQNI
ncbi:hypothetical protein EVAR_12435_1 [Eumeta japonica]|uniref:Uncharacterized protein n=1 Tax=Eumeta variegata TaxID=151549 RepID=A0A4C1TZ88_EUMVA|nr:hypothetical protein EVAR_12435_1 [Eumeta japonica]